MTEGHQSTSPVPVDMVAIITIMEEEIMAEVIMEEVDSSGVIVAATVVEGVVMEAEAEMVEEVGETDNETIKLNEFVWFYCDLVFQSVFMFNGGLQLCSLLELLLGIAELSVFRFLGCQIKVSKCS